MQIWILKQTVPLGGHSLKQGVSMRVFVLLAGFLLLGSVAWADCESGGMMITQQQMHKNEKMKKCSGTAKEKPILKCAPGKCGAGKCVGYEKQKPKMKCGAGKCGGSMKKAPQE
jgi:uncharacterized low-complexity protein